MAFKATGASGNYLRPPSNTLVGTIGTGTWTIISWIYPTSTTGYQNIWYANNNHALQTNGSNVEFWYGGTDNLGAFSTNTWYCLAVAKNGTTEIRYLKPNGTFSNRTTGIPSTATNDAFIGTWAGTDDWPSHRFGPMKIYDAFLTDNEILQESLAIRPIRTADLRAFFPFWNGGATERVIDYSGNARNLTQTGTAYTDEAGPAIPYGIPLLPVLQASASNQNVTPEAANANATATIDIALTLPTANASASAQTSFALTLPTADASATAPAPSIALNPIVADASATAPAPSIALNPQVADASATAPAPSIALNPQVADASAVAQVSLALTVLTADASATTPVPSIGLSPQVADASATAPAPSIALNPQVADASATAPAPSLALTLLTANASASASINYSVTGGDQTITPAVANANASATVDLALTLPAVDASAASSVSVGIGVAPSANATATAAADLALTLPVANSSASTNLLDLTLGLASATATATSITSLALTLVSVNASAGATLSYSISEPQVGMGFPERGVVLAYAPISTAPDNVVSPTSSILT